MTTMFPQETVCGLCGDISSLMEAGSTSRFGPTELDNRPGSSELDRPTCLLSDIDHTWRLPAALCKGAQGV